jgi:hypothetical protein
MVVIWNVGTGEALNCFTLPGKHCASRTRPPYQESL